MAKNNNNEFDLSLPPLNIILLFEKTILGGIIFILALPLLGDYGLWLFPIGKDILFKLTIEFLWLLFLLKIIFEKSQTPSPLEVSFGKTISPPTGSLLQGENAHSNPNSKCPKQPNHWLFKNWPLVSPCKTPIALSILSFWFISLLATITSVQQNFSFWGNIYKNQGLLTWTHYVLFFFLVLFFLNEKKLWQLLMHISIAVASAVSLIALWQILQHDFAFRVSATLNNSNYLAAYLVLLLPITFAHFRAKRSWWLAGAALLQLTALFFTQTRGGYLGIGVALLAFLIFYLNTRKDEIRYVPKFLIFNFKSLIITLALLAVTSYGLLVTTNLGQSFQQKLPDFTDRFLNAQSIKNASGPRLEAWRAGWQGMLEKPLLGYGPENFFVAYDEHYSGFLDNDVTPIELSPWEAWFDKAHNFIFDIGSTTGFLGLLAYIAIFVSAIWVLIKRLKIMNDELKIVSIGLTACFVGYLTQNLLGFDTMIPGIYLIFLLAYSSFLTSPYYEYAVENTKHKTQNTKVQVKNKSFWTFAGNFGFWLLAFGFLALFILSLKIHANILKSNHQLNLAEALARSGKIEDSFAAFQKGLDYDAPPINPNLRRRYAVIALAYYDAIEKRCNKKLSESDHDSFSPEKCKWLYNDSKKYLAYALELQQENAAREWPHFTRNYIYAAQIANILGKYEESDKYFESALKLSPKRKSVRSEWNLLLKKRQEVNGAPSG